MRSFAALLFLVCTLALSAQRSPLSPSIRKLKNDTIIWKPDSLLRSADFKGKTKPGNALGLSALSLFLYSGEQNGQLLFYVEALFIKSKSYIAQNTDYVLRHEQTHFDLCELYARMLRKKIDDKDFSKVKNFSSEINKLFAKTNQELWKEQNRYDSETGHGINPVRQKEWNESVQARLKELDRYSSTVVNILE